MHLSAFRKLGLEIAQAMTEDPTQLMCGHSTPEQQREFYVSWLEYAENCDDELHRLLADNEAQP